MYKYITMNPTFMYDCNASIKKNIWETSNIKEGNLRKKGKGEVLRNKMQQIMCEYITMNPTNVYNSNALIKTQ